jgi:hypothetical protein
MSVLTGNDEQLRATWRILISFVVFFGILLIANTVLRPLPWPDVLTVENRSIGSLRRIMNVLQGEERTSIRDGMVNG